MTANYDRTVRITIAILVVICLAEAWLLFAQHRQIERLRAIDCLATEERRSRLDLYDGLIAEWEAKGEHSVAATYRTQRVILARVAAEGQEQCDSGRG